MQKHYLQCLIFFFMAVFMTACHTDSQKEKQTATNDSLTTQTQNQNNNSLSMPQAWAETVKKNIHLEQPIALKEQAAEVQLIIGSDTGVVRGFYLGDSIQKVLQHEQAWLIEDDSCFKTFSIDLNRRRAEMIDIQYFTDSLTHQLVESIVIDIYQADANAWYDKMYDYYTARYGKPTKEEKGKQAAWQSPAAYRVVLEKKTIKQAPGIRIRYMPLQL